MPRILPSTCFAVALLMLFGLIGCAKPDPLTEEFARSLVLARMADRPAPVYAEVPVKVWWGPDYPKDEFDEKSIATLENLQKAGLLTYTHTTEPGGVEVYQAKVTKEGFPLLGTAPSHRGKVYRGLICYRITDSARNFIRHPSDPTVGRIEVVWHYGQPTPLYPLFETKIRKPLNEPFISVVSIHWDKSGWQTEMIVKKEEAEK